MSIDGHALLRSTRRLTVLATVFLGFQLYGNLYEQIVTNVRAIADPQPGALVGPLSAGSPLFFYLPWAPVGVVLVFSLTARLRRHGPPWIARRATGACAALLVAVAAKTYLIGWVNPTARDSTVPAVVLRAESIHWAFVNGIAILAVTAALTLLLSWRPTVADVESWTVAPNRGCRGDGSRSRASG
jgi:hypothetical protein